MAAKIYTNPNMVIDTSSDFGPDEIMDYIGQFEQMRTAKSADARAERMAVLQEAQMKYQQGIQADTKSATEYLNQSVSEGFDYDNLYSDNFESTFGKDLPNPGEGYSTYVKRMAGLKLSAMSRNDWNKEWGAGAFSYVNQQIGKFNALRETYRSEYGMNDEQLNALMKDKGANELMENAQAIYGYAGQPFNASNLPGSTMQYEPPAYVDERGWWAKTFQEQPDVTVGGKTYTAEGESTGISGGKIAAGIVTTGAAIGAYGATETQVRTAADEIIKEATKNMVSNTKKNPTMEAGKFLKEYGVNKSTLKKMSEEELMKLARSKGWDKTTISKIVGGFKGMDKAALARKFAGGMLYLAPQAGKALDEAAGTGDVAQTTGTAGLLYHMIPHKQKAGFMQFLAKKLPATLAKQATKAAARHTASAATGIGANPYWQGAMLFADIGLAGYSIVDLINEYNREG
jgi:hypothetical protein